MIVLEVEADSERVIVDNFIFDEGLDEVGLRIDLNFWEGKTD